ncbi:MAG: hypothetical protein ACE5OR_06450 [bacterium]
MTKVTGKCHLFEFSEVGIFFAVVAPACAVLDTAEQKFKEGKTK